jgi:hypothetical protein
MVCTLVQYIERKLEDLDSKTLMKLLVGSYLNVALEARHRRRVEADWLGAV